MNDKFFHQINNLLLVSETVNITIRKNNEIELTVSVNPLIKVQDKAKDLLQPILFTGTVEEFDAQFFQLLTKPLEQTSGLLRNIHQHEKSVEKASEESAIAKAEKDKLKLVRDKSIKDLVKAQKYFDDKEYDKSKFLCQQILKLDPKFSKASQLILECADNVAPDMFSQESTEAPKEPIVEEEQPLPDVPRAEPVVTQKVEDNINQEMEIQEELAQSAQAMAQIQFEDEQIADSITTGQNAPIEEDKTPPTQENNSLGAISDEQAEMVIEEQQQRLNNTPDNGIRYY